MHCHVKTWGAIHQKSVKSTSVNSALYVLYNVLGKRRGEVNAMEKLIITACICGAEVTKEHNPAVPYTVEEIAKEAKSAYDAGASIIHLHVREDDGTPTQSKERFEACFFCNFLYCIWNCRVMLFCNLSATDTSSDN